MTRMKTGFVQTAKIKQDPQKLGINRDLKRKTVTKNLRMDSNVNVLIEQAAASSGTTFTSFVLEAAAARAERHLLDKCFIAVDGQSFSEIEQLLAADHQPTHRLKKLFALDKISSDESDNFAEKRLAP